MPKKIRSSNKKSMRKVLRKSNEKTGRSLSRSVIKKRQLKNPRKYSKRNSLRKITTKKSLRKNSKRNSLRKNTMKKTLKNKQQGSGKFSNLFGSKNKPEVINVETDDVPTLVVAAPPKASVFRGYSDSDGKISALAAVLSAGNHDDVAGSGENYMPSTDLDKIIDDMVDGKPVAERVKFEPCKGPIDLRPVLQQDHLDSEYVIDTLPFKNLHEEQKELLWHIGKNHGIFSSNENARRPPDEKLIKKIKEHFVDSGAPVEEIEIE